MDDMVEEAFDRYVTAKRSGGHFLPDEMDGHGVLEGSLALERVCRARVAVLDMLRRKPVTWEDRALTEDLKAELYRAERELDRLHRARESASASHLL